MLRGQLRPLLEDWSALLTEDVTAARPLLSLVLAGQRISFERVPEGYELTMPVAIDRMLATVIPAIGNLQ